VIDHLLRVGLFIIVRRYSYLSLEVNPVLFANIRHL